jgi:hypothetical protein
MRAVGDRATFYLVATPSFAVEAYLVPTIGGEALALRGWSAKPKHQPVVCFWLINQGNKSGRALPTLLLLL